MTEVSKLDQLVDRCDTLVHGIIMNDAEALRLCVWTIAACLDDAKAELLRLRSPTEARGEVKPLKWRVPTDHPSDPDIEDNVYCADGMGGKYAISRKQSVGPERLLWMAHDPFEWHGFNCIAEAKAAAQADYSSRILSALSNPPAREAVDEEMVEAGARAIDALWSEQQARHYVFEDTDREYQAHCRDTARAALLAALQVKP